jgi:hypothetical protein
MYKHVKACVHREQVWQAGQAGQAGQAWQAGQAGQAGQAEQAGLTAPAFFSTISFVETSNRARNAHSGIHTRASRKPTEMSRCSRIRKRIKMLKPLNTNGNGF